MRESEERFRTLIDSSPTAVILYQDKCIIYANRATVEMSNYSLEEMIGMHFSEFVHPDYREFFMQRGMNRQYGNKSMHHCELKLIMKNGVEKWVDLTDASAMIGGRPARIISVIDITERRRAEEALKESEGLYTTLVNTIPDVVIRTTSKAISSSRMSRSETWEASPRVIWLMGIFPISYLPKTIKNS